MLSNDYQKIIDNKQIWINYQHKLGQGNYGIVYKGIDGKANIPVAIKVMLNASKGSRSIKKQMEIGNKVKHENLIQYYDFIQAKDNVYIVMEYAGGGTLEDLIKEYQKQKQQGLPEKVAFDFFKQMLEGIYALHKNDIIHRDIKPQNILLDQTKKIIKIADFGQAVFASVMKTLRQGTPLYMAPEQLNPRGPYPIRDRRSDVWSFGLVLYEMLVGTHLFEKFIQQSHYTFQHFIQQNQKCGFMNPPFPQELEQIWTTIREQMLKYNYEERVYLHQLKIIIKNSQLEQILNKKYLEEDVSQNKYRNQLQKTLNQLIAPSTLTMTEDQKLKARQAFSYLQFFLQKHLLLTKLFNSFTINKYPFIPMGQKYILVFLVEKAYINICNQILKELKDQKITNKHRNEVFSTHDYGEPTSSKLRDIFEEYSQYYREQINITEFKIKSKLIKNIIKDEEVQKTYPQVHKFIIEEAMQHSQIEYLQVFQKYFNLDIKKDISVLQNFYPLGDLKTYLLMLIIVNFDSFFSQYNEYYGALHLKKFYQNLVNWKKKKDRARVLEYINSLNN